MIDLDGGALSLEAVEAVARRGEEVRLAPAAARTLGASRAFVERLAAGAEILGLEAGAIAPGQLADLVAVDLGDPSMHPRIDLLKSVVYAMSDRAVTDVWVHGRRAVESGRLVSLDERDLLARVRELTRGWRVPEAIEP